MNACEQKPCNLEVVQHKYNEYVNGGSPKSKAEQRSYKRGEYGTTSDTSSDPMFVYSVGRRSKRASATSCFQSSLQPAFTSGVHILSLVQLCVINESVIFLQEVVMARRNDQI